MGGGLPTRRHGTMYIYIYIYIYIYTCSFVYAVVAVHKGNLRALLAYSYHSPTALWFFPAWGPQSIHRPGKPPLHKDVGIKFLDDSPPNACFGSMPLVVAYYLEVRGTSGWLSKFWSPSGSPKY